MEVVLAHGASGSAASMRRYVEGLERRTVPARAIDLPVRRAEEAIDAFRLAAVPSPTTVIGGQSYGGRVASLLAAEPVVRVAGLVLFCYPLHRPGHPEWEPRTAHWPSLRCPVLLLSGDADPFARIDLLRRAVAERLMDAQLAVFPGQRHGLGRVLDAALDHVAAFVEGLSPAR
jgi:predicted alpha/beta-hydrolase family hydrolase